jgi:hypothetical protein
MNDETLQRILDDQPDEWEDLHVVPLDDLFPHSDGTECLCSPRVEVHGAKLLIIHNSFDGREDDD